MRNYVLTPTARRHLREAKAWSRTKWGDELTTQYFHDLEKAAQFIAENYQKFTTRQELTGESWGDDFVRENQTIFMLG